MLFCLVFSVVSVRVNASIIYYIILCSIIITTTVQRTTIERVIALYSRDKTIFDMHANNKTKYNVHIIMQNIPDGIPGTRCTLVDIITSLIPIMSLAIYYYMH